ncbi:hypothetical protein JW823_06005 [bacterium]|nr:hypothetical protein [candidate division CSSED10-310 bacterium]
MEIFNNISVSVTSDLILDHLYPPDYQGPPRKRDTVRVYAEWAAETIQSHAEPKGILSYLEQPELQDWPYMAEHTQAVAGIVTLGHGLDRDIDRLNRIDPVKAVFLDAAAAVAVESACDCLDDAAGSLISERHLARTPRISPGFGEFPLSDQQYLFRLVPGHLIGVTLTPGSMMTPLKSVSFVILAGENPENLRQAFTCDMCVMINCPLRYSGQRCSKKEV